MILQGRNLTQGVTGADVAALHNELTELGYTVPATEKQATQFGAGTLALVEQIQSSQGLAANGTVDDTTAAALTDLVTASTYNVSGQVTSPVSASLGGLTVQLVDKNVGSDVTVKSTTTDPSGAYSISAVINVPTLNLRRKTLPDLQVRVLAGTGAAPTLLALSAVVYNAATTVTIDVVLPADASGLASEYETLTTAISTLYTGALTALQENDQQQDISFLANKSGWDARTVAMAALAQQFAALTAPALPPPPAAPATPAGTTPAAATPAPPPAAGTTPPAAVRITNAIETPVERPALTLGGGTAAGAGTAAAAAASAASTSTAAASSSTASLPPSSSASTPATVSLQAEFFYALFRAGLPANADTLFQAGLGTVQSIWTQAIAQGVIPQSLSASTAAAAQAFQSLGAAHVLGMAPAVGLSKLQDQLAPILSDTPIITGQPSQQAQFAQLLNQYDGDWDNFWPAVTQAFGASIAGQLQFAGQLHYLTLNNAPLIAALHTAESQSPLSATVDLATRGYYAPAKWTRLIGASIPPGIPGTAAEQPGNYANYLAAHVRIAHPTACLADQIGKSIIPIGDTSEVAGEVALFLAANHSQFEFGVEPVESFLNRQPSTFTHPSPKAVAQIKRVQRVYQLTPDDTSLGILLQNNLDSAYAITRYDTAEFVRAFESQLGGVDAATAIHVRAKQIFNTVLNVATHFALARTAPALGGATPMYNLDPTATATTTDPNASPATATLQTLFGSLDYSDCSDCSSILSPAAYLVDLLHYIDRPAPTNGKDKNPQSVLFSRRPDLEYLPLTCANTNTALPYIDVVNETLEFFVANNLSLDGYQGHDTGATVSSAELLASPQHVDEAAYTKLQGAFFPAPLPFNRPLELLRRHMQVLGVALPDAMIALRANDDMNGSAANPASFGWNDILIEQLGISRDEYRLFADPALHLGDLYGLPRAAGQADAQWDTAALTQLQNMSLHDFSQRVAVDYDDLVAILQTQFINPSAGLLPRLQRLNAPFSTLTALQANVAAIGPDFIDALPAGLDATQYGGVSPTDYPAVVTWVTSPQVATGIATLITIANPSGTGADSTGAALQLRYAAATTAVLHATDFLKLIRFIRLWRKLQPLLGDGDDSVTIAQTDALLTALYPAAKLPAPSPDTSQDTNNRPLLDTGFANTLQRAGFAFQILNSLSLTPDAGLLQLLACWADIGTVGPNALYRAMFLMPTMLQQDPGVRTATVSSGINSADVLTTTINGVAITHPVAPGETPTQAASAIVAAIAASTKPDPVSGEAINARFAASSLDATISIRAGFAAKCQPVVGVGTETYVAGTATPTQWTATVAGSATPSDILTTTIDGVPISYTVVAGDTPQSIAAGIRDAVNATTVPHPYSGLPLNTIVVASSSAAGVVTLITAGAGAPFSLVCGIAPAAAASLSVATLLTGEQAFTLAGTFAEGALLTASVNGLDFHYTVAKGDTPTIIAANIAKSVTTSLKRDLATNLPLASVFTASVNGGVINFTPTNKTAPVNVTASQAAATYVAGRAPSPFADTTQTLFPQTLFAHEPLLCAACNLTGAEFALIASELKLDATALLTLDNVSALFRYGWLAHALGISVIEFLRFRRFSGLDPFQLPDPAASAPAEPPVIRFIRLAQALGAAGMAPAQALYLIWNQDVSGSLALDQSDVLNLASALRADFAAVEAQFSLQDDPNGSIAQALMALVYGAGPTGFFFGLLNNTFSVSTPCSYGAPSLPQAIVDASGGRLGYDDVAKQLSFCGVLDSATQQAIVAAATVNTTDGTDNVAAGGAVTLTPKAMTNIAPGVALLVDGGAAQETVVVAGVGATSFTATTANPHNGTVTPFAILNDPRLIAALTGLAAANKQAIAPFFAQYPELQAVYAAYAGSNDPIQTRRNALLANFLPILKRARKQEQALAAITAAVGSDPSFAGALLQDASVLHADNDPTAGAVTDLTAIETGGLSVQFFLGGKITSTPDLSVDFQAPMQYGQTATLAGAVATGITLTTTVNGVAITYATTTDDTDLTVLAANIATTINAATAIDAGSGLPINRLLRATAVGAVIGIVGQTATATNSAFSLLCASSQPGLTYAAGSQLPAGAGGGAIAGIWSGFIVAPQDGHYNFAVVADSGATVSLEIGGQPVFLNQAAVALGAGAPTPIMLTASGLKTTLALSWQNPPGLGWQLVPAQALYPANPVARLGDTYVRFLKSAALASALSLTADEVAWLGADPTRMVDTTCTSTVAAGTVQLTPASTANIAVGSTLVIDTGAAQEAITVTSVSATGTITAALAHPHDGSTTPFPIVGQPAPDVGLGWLNLLPGQPDPDPINAPNPDLATASRLGGVLSTLLAFSRIKQAFSPGDERLLQLLQAPGALLPSGQPALIGLTGWSAASVNALLKHFFNGLSPAPLADVENFRRVYDAYQIGRTCGVAASTVISALSNAPTATAVNALQSALRAQYAEADWLTVIRPINDAIRIVQRDALVAYILQGFISQPPTEPNSIGDTIDSADKLFEFFLIDPMTQPAVETSRLRLALSSVQLFVERILRNLEPNVSPGDIDPAKWEWMKRYRVWQANREVFLWPENWLYPQLRDDTSPIFEQTMSALLQGDITDDAATSAYLDYLSSLEEVAKLEPCGLYYAPGAANPGDITYVVARTAGAHRKHYFRQLSPGGWSPWSEVQIDCEDMPLTPIVWNVDGGRRLFLFWLKILKESTLSPKAATKPHHQDALKMPMVDRTVNYKKNGKIVKEKQPGATIADLQDAGPPTSHAAGKVKVRAVLCWSEFYNGKWQPAKTSDTNRAADLGTFDSYGSDSFDSYRNLVKINPATCTGHNLSKFNSKSLSDALILRLSVQSPDPGSAPVPKPGFVLHNTHSLPTLMEDITASDGSALGELLDSPGHWRAFRPAPARYTGGSAAGRFKINYYNKPEKDGPTPSPALSNTVLRFNWAPRFVDAQPGIGGSHAWDAPFIYEDKRNLFFVTTDKRYPAFSLSKGFGMSSPVFRGLGAGAEITPLVVGAAAAAATNSGPADSLQIASGQASGVRFGLNDAAAVSFQTSNIVANGVKVAKTRI